MKAHGAKILLLIAGAAVLWESAAGQIRPQAGLGRNLISSVPPTTDDWLLVLEILSRGADRTTEMAADATVCVRADPAVIRAIFQLYQAPGLETARGRLARPVSGLQGPEASAAAMREVMETIYPPDHELCVAAGKAVMRTLGGEGVMLIVNKLAQWGELPTEEDLDSWPGMALTEILANNTNADAIPFLLSTLKGGEGMMSSGGRLGAACALLSLGDRIPDEELQDLIAKEPNPAVRDCLIAVTKSGRVGEERRRTGEGETL